MDGTIISKATGSRRFDTVVAEHCLSAMGRGSSSARRAFKWSRTFPDLQRAGRDVAKDNGKTASIASLTKSLDQCDRSAVPFSACGRISAESLPTVSATSHHRLMLVSRTKRQRIGEALVASTLVASNCDGSINVNLTAVAGAGRPSARVARHTNTSSGRPCEAARQAGSVIGDVVTRSGVSHEKYGYAGV